MDKEEQLQKLLRLKRHEQPPEGFAEEFLEKFQRRQRTELVRRSALSILWERSQAWLEGLRRPVVIWSAAGAYGVLMLSLWLLPRHSPSSGNTTAIVFTAPPVNAPTVSHRQGSALINTDGVPAPGKKRRTPDQTQEKESVIGPETKPESYTPPPLREL